MTIELNLTGPVFLTGIVWGLYGAATAVANVAFTESSRSLGRAFGYPGASNLDTLISWCVFQVPAALIVAAMYWLGMLP